MSSLDFEYVSKLGIMKEICRAFQSLFPVLPNFCILQFSADPRWILRDSFIIQIRSAPESDLSCRTTASSPQNHIKYSFEAFRMGTKQTSGRQSCRIALPHFQKTCHEKSGCVIGSLALMHHPLLRSPPSLKWQKNRMIIEATSLYVSQWVCASPGAVWGGSLCVFPSCGSVSAG